MRPCVYVHTILQLSVVLRVGLTFFLAIIFLLSGVNKTTDSFHRPTHLFLASMFPGTCMYSETFKAASRRVI